MNKITFALLWLAVLLTACGAPVTPAPTYTPNPTYTPYPPTRTVTPTITLTPTPVGLWAWKMPIEDALDLFFDEHAVLTMDEDVDTRRYWSRNVELGVEITVFERQDYLIGFILISVPFDENNEQMDARPGIEWIHSIVVELTDEWAFGWFAEALDAAFYYGEQRTAWEVNDRTVKLYAWVQYIVCPAIGVFDKDFGDAFLDTDS